MSCEPRKCEHIKTNGVRCGSPALRDENFCYFHHRARRDFPHRAEPAPVPGPALDIPFPEDADAIQYGLGKVMYGLLNGLIDHKSAGLVLYALQTASGNLKNTSLFKRSQKADEEDRSNVSPLLAYYLGPSREDYSRVLRILQEAEADLKNKSREIADLKQRLGEPCEEEPCEGESSQAEPLEGEPSTEVVTTEPAWVERLRHATATEPREERYPRNVEPARMRVDIKATADIQATVNAHPAPADTHSVPPNTPSNAGVSPTVARATRPRPVPLRPIPNNLIPNTRLSDHPITRLPNPCAVHHRIQLAPIYNRESVNLS